MIYYNKVKINIKNNNMSKKLEARSLLVFFGAVLTVLFFVSGQAMTAKAVTVTTDMSGNLVKGSSSAVYFVGSDNKRYIFPNETVFFSWYADFSTVKTVTDEELADIPVGGDVVVRAGVRLVKSSSDTKVYVVSSDGSLQWVSTEALAQQLFGADWAKRVENVPNADFTNLQIGNPIVSASDYNATSGDQNPSAGANNANVPPTADQNENANNNTNAPASGTTANVFKIISVSAALQSVDATTDPAAQVWGFDIAFSQPPSGSRLTVTEKISGAVFYNEPIIRGTTTASTAHILIGNATAKLKMNTTYSWKVIAYAAPNATAAETATSSGEFTTVTASVVPPANTNVNTPPPAANINTNSPAAGEPTANLSLPFNIVSVSIDKVDAQGKPAEDVRSFGIVFSRTPIGARLTIVEKSTGIIFYSNSIGSGIVLASTVYVKPNDWTAKLKPSTAYIWKVTANADSTASAGNPIVTDSATGDFTTSDFTPAASPAAGTITNTPAAGVTGAYTTQK